MENVHDKNASKINEYVVNFHSVKFTQAVSQQILNLILFCK